MAIMETVRRAEFEWRIQNGQDQAQLLLHAVRSGARLDVATHLPPDLRLVDSGIRKPPIGPTSPGTSTGHLLWARYEADGR